MTSPSNTKGRFIFFRWHPHVLKLFTAPPGHCSAVAYRLSIKAPLWSVQTNILPQNDMLQYTRTCSREKGRISGLKSTFPMKNRSVSRKIDLSCEPLSYALCIAGLRKRSVFYRRWSISLDPVTCFFGEDALADLSLEKAICLWIRSRYSGNSWIDHMAIACSGEW
jgi:hypothetical protein